MDKINDISTKIAKLDSLINSNFEFIKTRIKDIKISKEKENRKLKIIQILFHSKFH